MRGRQLAGLGIGCLLVATMATAAAKEWPARLPSAQDRGQELYDRHCLACHGPTAAGDGAAAAALVVKPPDLSKGFGGKHRDELVGTVLRGKGAMPGFDLAFRDMKAHSGGTASFAKMVLDVMEDLGREDGAKRKRKAKEEPDEEEAEGDAP